MALLDEEAEAKKHPSREEYFLAMIAYQIYIFRLCIIGSENKEVLKYEDFLLKFKDVDDIERLMGDDDLADKKLTDEQKKSRASKAAWLGFVGLGKDGKPPQVPAKKKQDLKGKGYVPKPLTKPKKKPGSE